MTQLLDTAHKSIREFLQSIRIQLTLSNPTTLRLTFDAILPLICQY